MLTVKRQRYAKLFNQNVKCKARIEIMPFKSLYILVTPKCVLWKTVKTLIKYYIRRHLISPGLTLFAKTRKHLQRKKYNTIWKCVTPQYIQWTIQNLLYQTRMNSLVHKRLRKGHARMDISHDLFWAYRMFFP